MKVQFNSRSPCGLGCDFILRPGLNDVPEEILRKWAEDSDVRRMLENGTISEPADETLRPSITPDPAVRLEEPSENKEPSEILDSVATVPVPAAPAAPGKRPRGRPRKTA